MAQYFTEESSVSHFLYSSKKSALLWLVVRVYLGYEWLIAGWDKINNPAWVGDSAGAAITGFVKGALAKTAEFCQPAPAPRALFVSAAAPFHFFPLYIP